MSKKIIDVHVHFGAPKDEESGCYWSENLKKRLLLCNVSAHQISF